MRFQNELTQARDLSRLQGYGCVPEVLINKSRFAQKYYPAGEMIVPPGDDETRVFIIKEGWGCISRCLRDGQRQLIEFPLAGDVVDLSSAATSGQEEFSALTDMLVWEGPSAGMNALAGSEIEVRRFLSEANRRRRSILVERMADIALRDAPTRIAHFLLEISVRLCLAGLPARPSYPCPLIQQDLADALGMTSIHVNRMLREARALGLYEFRRGEVVFLDYAATVAFAEFDRDFLSRPEIARSRARGVMPEQRSG